MAQLVGRGGHWFSFRAFIAVIFFPKNCVAMRRSLGEEYSPDS
jgi:hypothetical protein